MSIQTTSTSFSPSTPRWKYDVFLSFRGDDTRKTFIDHLYTALEHQGIITFRDDPELKKGKVISTELFATIEESRFAIIVLSQNYASSTWCLDELVTILECMKAREMVLPIFYNVDPSDVRKQRRSFGEAFVSHEERFMDNKEKVQRWRCALTEVASISGWNSKEWYESQLITNIVEVIWTKLQPTSFSYAENLVGIDSRLQQVNLLLGAGVDDVRFIRIWGMGGIGKTTVVRVVYDRIAREFECSFLLTDVRNSVEKNGLLNLQKQLLSGIWTKKADITDLYEGATIIRRLLGHKKVLLILDDVSHSSHLKYLAGNQDWFGSGSRVLITTRNEHLLIVHGVERRLKVEELNDKDSLQLFSWKAFKRGYPEVDFLPLSKSFLTYAKGLPLAIEVLGSFLHERDESEWKSVLGKLGRVCNLEIFDVLRISYDDLDDEEKKIFLDIACFFNGHEKDRVTKILSSCDVSAIVGIKVLTEKSLLTISHGRLWVHDLLQEMGQTIVRLESPIELGGCSRLWLLKDVEYVLTKNTGTEAIEGIFLESVESGLKVDVTPKSFSMMNRLRYLKIKDGNLPKGLEYLPNSLRILDWMGYPSKSLPSHFNPQKLFELSLCHSCIKRVRIGNEALYSLKTINLSHSLNLVNTPNFKGMPNLEVLVLEGCIRLYEVDPTIEMLARLIVLNLKDCKNLVHFASSVSGLKSLKVLNLSGCLKLKKLPDELGHVACLEMLDVSRSGVREVPSSIGLLKNLRKLSLAGFRAHSPKFWSRMFNPFQSLLKRSCVPAGLSLAYVSGLHSLTELNLSDCNLSEEAIPSDFGRFASLSKLNLSDNQFVELPESISQLASLRSLILSKNQFVQLPESIRRLTRLETLDLDWCQKLQTLPELPSLVKLDLSNCISLNTLAGKEGQYSPVREARCVNCFKMVEKETCGSIALSLLAHYLKFRRFRTFDFIFPGNEIPEWYSYQSVGCSVNVELHPGWFTDKFMGFTSCAVFEPVKPSPFLLELHIDSYITANERILSSSSQLFFEKSEHLVLDHIWFTFSGPRSEWQDLYYQLVFSFRILIERGVCQIERGVCHHQVVEAKKCGLRLVYEEDAKELWQRVLKQSNVGINTKRGLQL